MWPLGIIAGLALVAVALSCIADDWPAVRPLHPVPGAFIPAGGHYGAPRPGGRVHNGLDLAAPEGTPILSPLAGVIVGNYWCTSGGGWTVLVRHDGWQTGYAHLVAPSPWRKGEAITRGAELGRVGSTGISAGPHLHLSVRDLSIDGSPRIDPAPWLGLETPHVS